MEERVKVLEKSNIELRKSVACIETVLPFLATREDLVRVEAKVDAGMAEMKAMMSGSESTMIKWFAGTAITIIATTITAIIAATAIIVTMLR